MMIIEESYLLYVPTQIRFPIVWRMYPGSNLTNSYLCPGLNANIV